MTNVYEPLLDGAILKDLINAETEYRVSPITVIGRAADAHIRIDSKHVSRQHVRITFGREGFVLEDLSRNGTFLNGDLVKQEKRSLNEGDIIEIVRRAQNIERERPLFRSRLCLQDVKKSGGFLSGLRGLFGY
ncbi:FHA domain-containing protein [Planctomycetota bacterium]